VKRKLEILADFFSAVEAACVSCKHQIAELTGVAEPKGAKKADVDLDRIKWQSADTETRPITYER
jgi:hypothetical protein